MALYGLGGSVPLNVGSGLVGKGQPFMQSILTYANKDSLDMGPHLRERVVYLIPFPTHSYPPRSSIYNSDGGAQTIHHWEKGKCRRLADPFSEGAIK